MHTTTTLVLVLEYELVCIQYVHTSVGFGMLRSVEMLTVP